MTALGVVYGDIGTSPLYAMRECFFGSHGVSPTPANVLGVLSLIVYSLLIVVSLKYVAVVLRADNDGEGGILALTALVLRTAGDKRSILIPLGIFGAALLYGDGMITPAITVLGAIEGLNIVTPVLEPYIVPVAVGILAVVFATRNTAPTVSAGGSARSWRRGSRCSPCSACRGSCASRPCCRRYIPHMPSPSCGTTVPSASPFSARCSSSSPAVRRSMPTWGTSGGARSGSPGSPRYCRRS